MKCLKCEKTVARLSSRMTSARGSGNAPYEIPVLTLFCPHCNVIIGVLYPPAA